MHTVELLEQAIRIAEALGYRVRLEWLDGVGGGHCQLAGQKSIFLDLSQDAEEHLDCVIGALQCDPGLAEATRSHAPELAKLLQIRRAA